MFLSIKDASALLNCSARNTQIAIQRGHYTARLVPNPNGGRKKYEILLDSLPEEAQKRYWEQVRAEREVAEAQRKRRGRPTKAAVEARKEAEAKAAEEAQANMAYLEAPGWQKDRVDQRIHIVTQTLGMTRKEIAAWLLAKGYECSAGTVYRWRKAYEAGGKNALFTGYGNRSGDSKIPDDVFDVFLSSYLRQSQPSMYSCWLIAKAYFEKNYSGKCPSEGSFEYRLHAEKSEAELYFARFGEAAYNRKYSSSVMRDYSQLTAGECAVGDHQQYDVLTVLPDGSLCRPWLTAWTDFKSRKFIGWDIHPEAPNSDHIFRSFRVMAANFGLPSAIYIDNGKDYRCKDFAGGRKSIKVEVNEEEVSSLMADLGIEAHFALPYNAQAKNIERRFRDVHGYFDKHCPGYTGTNVVKRPEVLKAEIKAGKILPFEEFKKLAESFLAESLNKLPFGRGAIFAKRTPDEIWAADNPTLRRASPESLSAFCQRTSRVISVQKNGVHDPDLDVWYWAEEFAALKGTKVYLRRDLDDYGTAWVFAEDGKLLCQAKIAQAVHPLANDKKSKAELKERYAAVKRERKAMRKKAAAPIDMTAEERLSLLRAGIASRADDLGVVEPEQNTNVIELQRTPIDKRVRQQQQYLKEATTDRPIPPALPEPQQFRKLALTWTELDYQERH